MRAHTRRFFHRRILALTLSVGDGILASLHSTRCMKNAFCGGDTAQEAVRLKEDKTYAEKNKKNGKQKSPNYRPIGVP